MNLKNLKEQVLITIDNLKNNGKFPKENNHYDYKYELNFYSILDPVEIFMRNLAKDILSFANSDGGIILIRIKEDKINGNLEDVGLDVKNFDLLHSIDLNLISQQFNKIAKVNIDLDLQSFQSGTRRFFYLLIEKQHQIIIPTNDYADYKLKKGEITYRISGKNETANSTTQEFNRFLQIKANEKNKEFMEIWSKLLPEMFDINPREVLILNPKNNKVYGYNSKDNLLSSSEIDIDQTENGIFNIILNAISAGEIGEISDTEGKPLYKIVGEIKAKIPREHISITTLHNEVLKKSKFNFSNIQLKQVLKHLNWVDDEGFSVQNPSVNPVNSEFNQFTWLENFDKIKNAHKVVFSENAIPEVLKIVNDQSLHEVVFGRKLALKNNKKKSKLI